MNASSAVVYRSANNSRKRDVPVVDSSVTNPHLLVATPTVLRNPDPKGQMMTTNTFVSMPFATSSARISRSWALTLAAALALLVAAFALVPTAQAQAQRSGEIAGQSDHVMTGTVTIEREGNQTFVVLSEDFSLDGAPDPQLGFGSGGEFDTGTLFSKLNSHTGAQRYEVPSSVDVDAYDTFTVWCAQFSVPLGSATLR